MKRCPKCTLTKSPTEFYKSKSTKDGLYGYCKLCHTSKNKASREKAIEADSLYYKKKHLRYSFGVDITHIFDKLYLDQSGLCKICGVSFDESIRERRAVIDHCHKTNVIRGLLCHGCNRGLGLFADDPSRIMRAIEYLR